MQAILYRVLLRSTLFLPIITGCAMVTHAPDFTKISVGMDKQEVIKKLGKPDSMSLANNVEYLKYVSGKGTMSGMCFGCKEHYVRLNNGKVDSYGDSGDRNSASDLGNVSYEGADAAGVAALNAQATAASSRSPTYTPAQTISPNNSPSGVAIVSCGIQPIPKAPCHIGGCVDGHWQQICD